MRKNKMIEIIKKKQDQIQHKYIRYNQRLKVNAQDQCKNARFMQFVAFKVISMFESNSFNNVKKFEMQNAQFLCKNSKKMYTEVAFFSYTREE